MWILPSKVWGYLNFISSNFETSGYKIQTLLNFKGVNYNLPKINYRAGRASLELSIIKQKKSHLFLVWVDFGVASGKWSCANQPGFEMKRVEPTIHFNAKSRLKALNHKGEINNE